MHKISLVDDCYIPNSSYRFFLKQRNNRFQLLRHDDTIKGPLFKVSLQNFLEYFV